MAAKQARARFSGLGRKRKRSSEAEPVAEARDETADAPPDVAEADEPADETSPVGSES